MSTHIRYDTPELYDLFYRVMRNGTLRSHQGLVEPCVTAVLQAIGLIDESGDYGEMAYVEVVKL